MSRSKLIAKIKKCLELARSANEHEAANALAMARRLMDEYGVDQSDIALADVAEDAAKGSGAISPARWELALLMTVARAIPVEPVGGAFGGWVFVGLSPAPEIAAYAFATLYRQLARARTDYMKTVLKRVQSKPRKTARADAFAEGWASALFSKIAALYPEQETDALVKAYIEKRFHGLVPVKNRQSAANGVVANNDRTAGYVQGLNVDLHHGVTSASAPLSLEPAQ